MIERTLYTARLIREETLSAAAQTKHLVFRAEDLDRFDFAAGQFVSMVAPKDGKTITRAYSLASAPRGNEFDLCLNRVQDGYFSNLLCEMHEGDTIHFHGPHGAFVLRNPLRDSIFVATGTGIAPIRGFVQWLFSDPARHEGKQAVLVYGTRYPSGLYYADYFRLMAHDFPNFHYITTLSRPDEQWQGARGYVQEHVRGVIEACPESERGNFDAYICGLNAMVSATRKMLKEELGWDRKRIVFERYD
ncbi:MAG TPA: FAD-dependent oxidoreductase [Terriglobales bacterium]|nr:FAD-dependent oxidoreductase [Terriglobales bacterium]